MKILKIHFHLSLQVLLQHLQVLQHHQALQILQVLQIILQGLHYHPKTQINQNYLLNQNPIEIREGFKKI